MTFAAGYQECWISCASNMTSLMPSTRSSHTCCSRLLQLMTVPVLREHACEWCTFLTEATTLVRMVARAWTHASPFLFLGIPMVSYSAFTSAHLPALSHPFPCFWCKWTELVELTCWAEMAAGYRSDHGCTSEVQVELHTTSALWAQCLGLVVSSGAAPGPLPLLHYDCTMEVISVEPNVLPRLWTSLGFACQPMPAPAWPEMRKRRRSEKRKWRGRLAVPTSDMSKDNIRAPQGAPQGSNDNPTKWTVKEVAVVLLGSLGYAWKPDLLGHSKRHTDVTVQDIEDCEDDLERMHDNFADAMHKRQSTWVVRCASVTSAISCHEVAEFLTLLADAVPVRVGSLCRPPHRTTRPCTSLLYQLASIIITIVTIIPNNNNRVWSKENRQSCGSLWHGLWSGSSASCASLGSLKRWPSSRKPMPGPGSVMVLTTVQQRLLSRFVLAITTTMRFALLTTPLPILGASSGAGRFPRSRSALLLH